MKNNLTDLFHRFAEAECKEEPLYAELCRRTANDEQILSLLEAADIMQRRPNLLLAAVHYLLLKGIDHRLAHYFPGVGPAMDTDAETFPVFQDFCAEHHAKLRRLIASRTTQTNEVGRCAALLPVLQQISKTTGRALSLIDVGTSAGLNLGVDLFRYEFPGHAPLGNADSHVIIRTRQTGNTPIPVSQLMPAIRSKFGIDIDPIDIFDEDQVLWLRACIWPHDALRAARFMAAVATMRAHPVRLDAGDSLNLIGVCLEQAAHDTTVVIFNSWVMTYFDAALRGRYVKLLEQLALEKGVFWVAAEAPGVVKKAVAPPLPPNADLELASGTLWSICSRNMSGDVTYDVLARTHPHGKWIQWTGT